jgi:phage minor structural protein
VVIILIIHILNEYEKVVGVLSNEAPFSCPFFDDLHVENIQTGTNTYTFSVPANHEMAEKLKTEGNIIFPDLDGKYQMFRIKNIEEVVSSDSYVKTVTTEHVAIPDLLNEIVRPTTLKGTLKQIMETLLKDIDYNIGEVETLESKTVEIEQYSTLLEVILQIAEEFQVEIQYEVIFNQGKIVDKLIHMKRQLGTVTNKLFTYSKDLEEVTRTENSEALVTALIGVGKGDEEGNVLTLANYNPKELPEGFYKNYEDDFIYSEDALQAYGINGKHRFGVYISDAEDVETLAQETVKELKARSVPYVTWEMSVRLLERVSGYEADKVRVGDTIVAKDITMKPTLMIQARILEVSRSYTNPENDAIVLGHYKPIAISNYDSVRKLQEAILANEQKWSSVGVTLPEVEEVVEGKITPIERDLNDIRQDVEETKEELKEKEYQIIRQSTEPAGDGYDLGQLWIDDQGFIYRWTGSEGRWKRVISVSLDDIGGVSEQEHNEAITELETSITETNEAIKLKANASELDVVEQRVSEAEATLSVQADAIKSMVTKTEFTDAIDDTNTRISDAESRIAQTENAIETKVSQSIYNADISNLKTRMETAESSITQHADQISSKVSYTDFTGNTIVSKINQSPSTVKIEAKNIELTGSVTFSSFDSDTKAKITNAESNASTALSTANTAKSTVDGWKHSSDTTKIDGGKIYTNSITTTQLNVDNIFGNSAVLDKIRANAINGNSISGVTISGGTFLASRSDDYSTVVMRLIDDGLSFTANRRSDTAFLYQTHYKETGIYNMSFLTAFDFTIEATSLVLSSNNGIKIKSDVDFNNTKLTNINKLTIADSGRDKGIEWAGGNGWKIYEAPNDLTIDKGNLQFVTNSTRRVTFSTGGGIYATGDISVGVDKTFKSDDGYVVLRAGDGRVYLQGTSVHMTEPANTSQYIRAYMDWVYTNAVDINTGTNVYIRPTSSGEVRVTTTGTTSTYRPIRASSFPTSSSILYKQNIKRLSTEEAFYLLNQTDVFTYHLNSNLEGRIYDKRKIGMIREMVPIELRDEDGVDTYSLVATLWKVVQEQQKLIEDLTERLQSIEEII